MIPLRSNASLLPFLEKEENSSLRTLLSVVSYEITPPWNMLDEGFTESVYLLGGTYGSWLYSQSPPLNASHLKRELASQRNIGSNDSKSP